MKNVFKTIALSLLVVVFAVLALSGCELIRKMQGAETTFPSRVSSAKTLSFKMDIHYKQGSSTETVNMTCYLQHDQNGKEEYAYVYSSDAARYASYKNIYADGKLYEVVNVTKFAGSYYIVDDVAVDCDDNLLYHVKQNILLIGAAALLNKATVESVGGETTYRYDVDLDGKQISIWYNKDVLVKFYALFTDQDGETTQEYTVYLSDYHFNETISSDVFARPDTYGITYIESPFAFETWMEIVTSLSRRLG